MKSKDLQPKLLYPAKLSFRINGQRVFSNKKKPKEYITTKPVLYEMVKGLLRRRRRIRRKEKEEKEKEEGEERRKRGRGRKRR